MERKTWRYYDALSSWKDYENESNALLQTASHYTSVRSWLDVGCGTGSHLASVPPSITRVGADPDPDMLAIAGTKLGSDVALVQAGVLDLESTQRFDVISVLFTAVAYLQTTDNLDAGVGNLSRLLNPQGVLLVEPYIAPDAFRDDSIHHRNFVSDDLCITRYGRSTRVSPTLAQITYDYMIGTPHEVSFEREVHLLGLFDQSDYEHAFGQAGLTYTYDAVGPMGRGLAIGQLASEQG